MTSIPRCVTLFFPRTRIHLRDREEKPITVNCNFLLLPSPLDGRAFLCQQASHHYLVIARHPDLDDIPILPKLTRDHAPLLSHMESIARRFSAKSQVPQGYLYGYHRYPSMKRLHLHVISKDFVSPHLKTKRHWNSFNTGLSFPLSFFSSSSSSSSS